MNPIDEASAWFARVRRGVMSLSERNEYERWLSQDANRAAIAEMEKIWGLMDGMCRPAEPLLPRKTMIAALCVSLMLAGLSCISSSGFWTSLDWANR